MAGEISLGGFSGYDTQAMVDALVASQRVSLDRLQARKTKLTAAQTAWNSIGARLGALGAAASGLSSASLNSSLGLSSSDPAKVSVSGNPRSPVALSIGVAQLARGSVYSVSGFDSSSTAIGAGSLTLSRGLDSLGVSGISAPSVSGIDLEVVQASAPAQISAATFPVTFSSDEVIELSVNSSSGQWSGSATIAAGTYSSAAELAAVLAPALTGAPVTVSEADGALVVASKAQGSAVTLSASGPAAVTLALGSSTGRDAIVVSGPNETVVSSLEAGQVVEIDTASGPVQITLGSSGGLSVGLASASAYVFGADSSLEDVAKLLNSPQSKFNATVVGSGLSSELIIASRDTGLSANVAVSWLGFSRGDVSQIQAAQDAQITIGSRTYSRESNSVTDLIAGATVSLNGLTGGSEVALTSQSSPDRLLAAAKTFVTAFNDALNTIASATAPNPANPALSGPLSSDSAARTLRREIVGSLNQVNGSGTYDRLTSIGMSMSRSGQLVLDDAAFKKAIATSPSEVSSLLTRSIGSAPDWVSLKSAPPTVVPGSYALEVTAAATQAAVESTAFAQLVTQETLTVSSGSAVLTVTLPVGSTPTSAAAALDARFAAAGLPLEATVRDGRLRLATTAFGSSADLTVASPMSSIGLVSASSMGADVAGTIAGAPATGSGTLLTSSSGASSGLAFDVLVDQAAVAAASGALATTVTYRPGLSTLIRSALERISGASGTVPNAQSSIAAALRRLDDNVTRAERLADLAESRIRRQFAALESAVAMLRSSVPSFPSLPSSGGQS